MRKTIEDECVKWPLLEDRLGVRIKKPQPISRKELIEDWVLHGVVTLMLVAGFFGLFLMCLVWAIIGGAIKGAIMLREKIESSFILY